MSAAFWRTGAAAALACVFLAPSEAGAKIMLITTGDTVTVLGKVQVQLPPKPETPPAGKPKGKSGKGQPAESPDMGLDMAGLEVVYHWSYGGLFWIDFWTWGGEYCVMIGDKQAVVIPPELAAKLLGRTDPPSRPFLYKFPLGLLILGGIAVLAVIGKVVGGRAEKAADADLDQYRKGAS